MEKESCMIQKHKNRVWRHIRFRVQAVHMDWKQFQDSVIKCVSREGAAMRTQGKERGLNVNKWFN